MELPRRVGRRRPAALSLGLVLALVMTSCALTGRSTFDPAAGAADPAPPTTTPSAPPDPAPQTAATNPAAPTARASTEPTRRPPRVQRHDRMAFARRGPVRFLLPSRRVEHIGYHQSGHDGARALRPIETSTPETVLERRGRGTGRRTAADIVVHPRSRITAPVTGTVVAANDYVLYCEHRDQLVFIAPDERPDWVVKVLHLRGAKVTVGDRVEAGVTRIARAARVLPFESQVESVTALPPWPHIHIEMIDPSIPDRPTPGPGCP